jgi:hypothetical protein
LSSTWKSKAKALQQKIQVQPVVKVAAGSKLESANVVKRAIYTVFDQRGPPASFLGK